MSEFRFPNTKNGRSALAPTLYGNGNNANMGGTNSGNAGPSFLNSLKTTASGAAAAVGKLFNPAAAAAAAGTGSGLEAKMAKMYAENSANNARRKANAKVAANAAAAAAAAEATIERLAEENPYGRPGAELGVAMQRMPAGQGAAGLEALMQGIPAGGGGGGGMPLFGMAAGPGLGPAAAIRNQGLRNAFVFDSERRGGRRRSRKNRKSRKSRSRRNRK